MTAAALALACLIGAAPPAVIDGDTFSLQGQTIRLEGIDAPELAQLCAAADGQPYACGVKAAAALKRILKAGPVACRATGRDRYGRTLAYCRAGSLDVNAEMVRRGWAMAFVRYSSAFVPEEQAARRTRRGLWKGNFLPPWEWRRR